MIINCKDWSYYSEEQIKQERNHVFVDGIEINCVWYLDTELGIVKTYDVFRDGQIRATRGVEREKIDAMRSQGRIIEAPDDDIISETIQGKVELVPYE